MNKNAIEVRNVTMKFNLMEEKVDSIKEYALKFNNNIPKNIAHIDIVINNICISC